MSELPTFCQIFIGKIALLIKEREWRFKYLEEIYEVITQDPLQATTTKYFPSAIAIYIGGNDEIPLELELAKIARNYNIIVISDSTHKRFPAKNTCTLRNTTESIEAPFPQDYLDFNYREVCFPVMPDVFDKPLDQYDIAEKLHSIRQDRHSFYRGEKRKTIGTPFDCGLSKMAIALAKGLCLPASMNLTYNEGGNTLLGNFEDGTPYAIIGQDSFDLTKILIESEFGRNFSNNEIKMAFAIDYGIKLENLFFIEQVGGDFHLDMNMAILGPKTVVIHDTARELQILESILTKIAKQPGNKKKSLLKLLSPHYNIRERFNRLDEKENISTMIKKIIDITRENLSPKQQLEELSAEQLEKNGFEVKRYPGRFELFLPEGNNLLLMNFFNMLTARTTQGEDLIITLGYPKDFESLYDFKRLFEEMIQLGERGRKVTIAYLDYKTCQQSLQTEGGISCRAIALPHDISQKE